MWCHLPSSSATEKIYIIGIPIILSTFLPDSFEIDKLIQAAVGSNDGSETLTDLYLKRCFHLHREEYAELAAIETEIAAIVR